MLTGSRETPIENENYQRIKSIRFDLSCQATTNCDQACSLRLGKPD